MTIRTATVQNVCEHPGTGQPLAGARVSVRLNTGAFTVDGTREKLRTRYATTDITGLWSLTLEINDDIDPAGTWYTVREAGGTLWTFQVTAAQAGQTVNLRDVLVASPANPDPIIAGVSQASLNAAVASLVNGAPGALDTLKELADAIGDDPNYAATVAGLIGGKVSAALLGAFNGVATLDGSGVVVQNPKLHAARHGPGGPDDLSGNYVPVAGGAVTGTLTVGGQPVVTAAVAADGSVTLYQNGVEL